MVIIAKKLKLVGSKGEKELEGLFDSGASYSCIEQEIAQQLETIMPLATPLMLGTAKKGENVEVKQRVTLDFYLNGYRFSKKYLTFSPIFFILNADEFES